MELNFEKISKTAKIFDSETSKLQPVNLSETSRDTVGLHQRAAESLQSFNVSSFCHNPTPLYVTTDLLMGCSILDV